MPSPTARRPLWVFVVLFGASLLLSLLIAGDAARRPSNNPHYLYMAQGWLEGRTSLEGKPPGYCSVQDRRAKRCRGHSYDDWAVVWTLELSDGSTFRGQRCASTACRRNREPGTEAWISTAGELRRIPRAEIESRHDRWFVSFPPGPAVVLLPFVALFGLGVWDVALTCLFAAMAPVLILWGLDRVRRQREPHHLWLAIAWATASPALFVGAHGSVWFTAQTLGALFTWAYLFAALDEKRSAWAGLWLALAMSCRPHAAFGVVLFAWAWHRRGRNLSEALRFAAPILIFGGAMMALNYVRFGDVFEFGHRYLDVGWQRRMQDHGQFSWVYVGRNLECLLWLWPQLRPEAPWFAVSLHGTALWLMSPWLLFVAGSAQRVREHPGLLAAALCVAALPLAYHNSGQRQLSYRFALDWLPYVVVLIAGSRWAHSRLLPASVLLGAYLSISSAWYFNRAPARIFVTDPVGWPFEDELRQRSAR